MPEKVYDIRCPKCGIIVLQYYEGTVGKVRCKCRRCKLIYPFDIPKPNKK